MRWRVAALSGILAAGLGAAPTLAQAAPVSDQVVVRYALSGDKVVYQAGADAPDGKDSQGAPRLYVADLKTGAVQAVPTKTVPDSITFSGNQFAYGGKGGLYLQPLTGGDAVPAVGGHYAAEPHLVGDQLLWGQPAYPVAYRDAEFFRKDLATGETKSLGSITFGTTDSTWPVAFDGQYLATSAYGTIKAVDTRSGDSYSVSTSAPGGFAVGVSNGKVVYAERNEGNQYFGLRLWAPGSGSQPTEAGGYSTPGLWTMPAVQGDLFAWIDSQNHVLVRNLKTGTQRTLASDSVTKSQVQVNDGFVTYLAEGKLQAVPLQENKPTGEPVFYTVQAGDVLWQIAQRQGVNLLELIQANNLLQPGALWPGQQFYLPAPVSPRYESYTVRPGDTLARIAVTYKTTYDALIAINGLKGTNLQVGQVLKVKRGANYVDAQTVREYAVMPGDTWDNLAARLGVPVANLLKLNNLIQRTALLAGQAVQIPY
jgi:LysM repeat protein